MGSPLEDTLMESIDSIKTLITPRRGLYATSYGAKDMTRRDDISSRYDTMNSGFVMGFDEEVAPSVLIGATMGHSVTRLAMQDLDDMGQIRGYQASLYGTYTKDKGYINALLGYGINDHSIKREVPTFAVNRSAQSTYKSHIVSAYTEGGLRLPVSSLDVIPLVGLQASHIYRGSFTETGARDLNLSVDSQSYLSLVSSLGVRVRKEITFGESSFIPEVKLCWDHNLLQDDRSMKASLAGLPSMNITPEKQDTDRLVTKMSLAYKGTSNLFFHLSYENSLSSTKGEHAGTVGVRYGW